MGRKRPNRGDRVQSAKLPGRVGYIVDWQPQRGRDPEKWLVKPVKEGELAAWLTRAEFQFSPEPRPWL